MGLSLIDQAGNSLLLSLFKLDGGKSEEIKTGVIDELRHLNIMSDLVSKIHFILRLIKTFLLYFLSLFSDSLGSASVKRT